MNTYTRSYLAAAAAFATVLLPGTVLARGHSAIIGIATSPAEAQCWSHAGGAVTNTCAENKRWCMPASVDGYGNFTGRVYARGATSANNVGCHTVGASKDLTTFNVSSVKYLPHFGTAQQIDLDAVYVPEFGTLYACCDVNPGGTIINYHYWW